MRTCAKCGEEKGDADFHKSQRSYCKTCHNAVSAAAARKRRAAQSDVVRKRNRDRQSIRLHGLTPEAKAELALAQGGCAICKRPDPVGKGWVMDHDHSCCPGTRSCDQCRRAVLCVNCNSAIGLFADDPNRMLDAAMYVLRYKQATGV